MRITVHHDDGTEFDITSLVQIAFDVSTHSMDWGSGFLDREEEDGLVLLAAACRFPDTDAIDGAWVNHRCEGMTWEDRLDFAKSRGLFSSVQLKPTDEEREEFVRELIIKYTPELTITVPKDHEE